MIKSFTIDHHFQKSYSIIHTKQLQTQNNLYMLRNRLNILRQQKQTQQKLIQNQLQKYHKNIVAKAQNTKKKYYIKNIQKRTIYEQQMRISRSKLIKNSTLTNIFNKKANLTLSRHMNARSLRDESIQNQKMVEFQKKKQLFQNQMKKNKIKLQKSKAKDKIKEYWFSKLNSINLARQNSTLKSIQNTNQLIYQLKNLEKNQSQLIQQVQNKIVLKKQLQIIFKQKQNSIIQSQSINSSVKF